MNLPFTIQTAYLGLRANRARSSLTILGVVIGIMSVMLITSLGAGAQALILGQLGGLGAETIVVRPGQKPSGPSDFAGTLFADSITDRDVDALARKTNVPEVKDISPVVFVSKTVSYGANIYRPSILGWDAEFMSRMMGVLPSEGDLFGEGEINTRAAVAIIGPEVRSELFGEEPAIGKYIRIGDKSFRVTGVLPKKGASTFFNIDKVIVIPYTTAQEYLLGINYYNEVMIRVNSPQVVERSVEDITATLRELHRISGSKKDDFYIETSQGVIEQITTILSALTAFLTAVVAISLLVGGIGVMNVMLVSVTERTKEIGLRMAIGATPPDILKQFLIEAMMLTGVGGIIGIAMATVLGYGASVALTYALSVDWNYVFPWSGALLGFGLSVIVGLVFGLYPARKASKMNPIEALRYE
jgi:ABC-type antimicrobial peptide transport system permease subunit